MDNNLSVAIKRDSQNFESDVVGNNRTMWQVIRMHIDLKRCMNQKNTINNVMDNNLSIATIFSSWFLMIRRISRTGSGLLILWRSYNSSSEKVDTVDFGALGSIFYRVFFTFLTFSRIRPDPRSRRARSEIIFTVSYWGQLGESIRMFFCDSALAESFWSELKRS